MGEVNMTVKRFLECFTKEEIINALATLRSRSGLPMGFYGDLFYKKSESLLDRMDKVNYDSIRQKTVAEFQKSMETLDKLNRQHDQLSDRFSKLEL